MTEKLVPILKCEQKIKNNLLSITFTSLAEYLYTLKVIAGILKGKGDKAMLYLAAAVSDFYIPPAKMVSLFKAIS